MFHVLVRVTNVAIEDVAFDSRKARTFSLFVAIPGTQVDGFLYISKAIENGAIAVVCERMPEHLIEGVSYVLVQRRMIAKCSNTIYNLFV